MLELDSRFRASRVVWATKRTQHRWMDSDNVDKLCRNVNDCLQSMVSPFSVLHIHSNTSRVTVECCASSRILLCQLLTRFFLHRKHRRLIKQSLGPNARRTLVEKILALLIESGFLYLAWWVSKLRVDLCSFSQFLWLRPMNCQGAMATSLVEYLDWGFGIQFQQHMWYMGNQVVVSIPPNPAPALITLLRRRLFSHSVRLIYPPRPLVIIVSSYSGF